MIQEQRTFLDPHIGRHNAALPQMEHVAGHEFLRATGHPRAVAPHPCLHAQLLPQQRQHLLRVALLKITQDRIEDEQSRDDRSLDDLAQKDLNDDRRFQQPRNRCPKLPHQFPQRDALLLNHRIRPKLLQPRLRLRSAQAKATVDNDAWKHILVGHRAGS